MVMFMASTMVCSYLCLLIRTFEAKSQQSEEQSENAVEDLKISKTNLKCFALGKYILPFFYIELMFKG